jgi:hypothetical protein
LRRGRLRPLALAAALLAGVLHAAPGWSQETRPREFPDLERQLRLRDHVKARLTLVNRFVAPSDFGSFRAHSYFPQARLRVTVPVAKNAGLQLLATGSALLYDFDGVSDLFGTGGTRGDPFGDLYAWTIRLQGAYLIDHRIKLLSDQERWSLLVEGVSKARWEEGSDVADALRWGGSVAVGYRIGSRLELAVGVSVQTRMERGGVSVSPFAEFDWEITDDWKLRSYGMGLQLERRLNDRFTVFGRARLEGGKFRLDDRGDGIGKGTISLNQLPAGLGLRWRISRHVRLIAVAGAMVYQEMKVKDDDREEIGRDRGGPAPYLTFRFDFRP